MNDFVLSQIEADQLISLKKHYEAENGNPLNPPRSGRQARDPFDM